MHFSKTYAQLLLGLPPELRDNAVQYRQVGASLYVIEVFLIYGLSIA